MRRKTTSSVGSRFGPSGRPIGYDSDSLINGSTGEPVMERPVVVVVHYRRPETTTTTTTTSGRGIDWALGIGNFSACRWLMTVIRRPLEETKQVNNAPCNTQRWAKSGRPTST